MASININVPGLPTSTKKPGTYFAFNTANANRGLPGQTDRIVLLGQRIASGTSPAGALVDLPDEAAARTAFGAGSILHIMACAAITANPYITLSALAIDDAPAAIAASAKISATGNASAPGVITITVASDETSAAVLQGDTPAAINTAITAAINAKPDWPVTAAVVAADVVITAKNKGTLGNNLQYAARNTAPGVTITLTSTTPGYLAGGQTDPSLAAPLTTIFPASHTLIVTSLADSANLALARTHAVQVSGPMEQREAMIICASTGTLSSATTAAGLLNSEWVSIAWLRGTMSAPWSVAAAYATIIASESDPANPLNDLYLPGLHTPPQTAQPLRAEQETALNMGVTPLQIGPGQQVQIVRAVTTRTLDPAGIRDESLLDIGTMRTLGAVRRVCRAAVRTLNIKKITPRNLLKIRSKLLVALVDMESLEWVKNVDANKPLLLVEQDLNNRLQVNARIPADVVEGMHIVGAVIDLL